MTGWGKYMSYNGNGFPANKLKLLEIPKRI